jgi:hypothetical protein
VHCPDAPGPVVYCLQTPTSCRRSAGVQRSRHVAVAARMMVKDTESGVEFPLGQKFW